MPLHVYLRTDTGTEKVIEHPLYKVLHDEPNPEMISFVFRETMMTHLRLWSNAYVQIIRNGKGEVLGLYPLMPDRMKVDRDDKGQICYEYFVSDSDAGTEKQGIVKLNGSDVLHIPGLGFDRLVGYLPIAMAKNAIGVAIATEEYGAKFFANGATLSGILEYHGTETLSLTADPREDGLVKSRTGDTTSADAYANWHKNVCMFHRLKVKHLNLQDIKEDFSARKNSKSRRG